MNKEHRTKFFLVFLIIIEVIILSIIIVLLYTKFVQHDNEKGNKAQYNNAIEVNVNFSENKNMVFNL